MIVAPAKRPPDSTMTYTDDKYRFSVGRLAIIGETVRPIHQRRVAIATVSETLSEISNAHPVSPRRETIELYRLMPGFIVYIMVAAYAAAGRMFVSRLRMSTNVPTHVSSLQ